jgi:hypothetical protein
MFIIKENFLNNTKTQDITSVLGRCDFYSQFLFLSLLFERQICQKNSEWIADWLSSWLCGVLILKKLCNFGAHVYIK